FAINNNFLYLAGYATAGLPFTSGAFQPTFAGGNYDAFFAQLCVNLCEQKVLGLAYNASSTSVCVSAPIKFTPSVNNACDTTGYKFHWVFTGGTPAVSDSVSPTVKFAGAGNYDVKLVVTTLCKKDSLTKINYITVNSCGGCTLKAQYTKGTANCSNCGCKEWVMVNATGGTTPYSYSWPDGYTNRYKNGLCPGAYTVNVKDKNGCSVNINLTTP
ncbi:MAG: PKD domain-containing protein, partial [Bacteroidia bacterium]|nr:PKD domain-containing protein [Bacteroidia bacterium]